PQLKKDYIDTGKVRLAFRDLPLSSIHPRAMPAALAAECAHEQGRFWEFHDLLFNNQKQMTDENFAKWAGDLKLDTTGFLSCYTTQKYKAEIDGDAGEAAKIGVNGTPGFIFGRTRPDGTLEGQYISGAQPYALFAQAIEAVMKTPPPPPPAPPKAGPSTSGPGLP
ncbi:MAG: DsbA family protein, partial [bacterium]